MKLQDSIDILEKLARECTDESLSLADFVQLLNLHHGPLLLVACLTMPFFSPIPLPGLSLILGTLVTCLGVSIFCARGIWVPSFLGRRILPKKMAPMLLLTTSKGLRWMGRFFKPRWLRFAGHPLTVHLSGALIAISGLVLALPLPPGTNAPPALVCLLLALGLLVDDGLLLATGMVLFIAQIFLLWSAAGWIYSFISNYSF